MYYHPEPDDDERAELAAQARANKRYLNRLARHPDCRDPDHPGCSSCMDEDEDEV